MTSILITLPPHFILFFISRPSGITHTHKEVVYETKNESEENKWMLPTLPLVPKYDTQDESDDEEYYKNLHCCPPSYLIILQLSCN